ncbi:MAG: DUF4276 family protein [Saprospiraceae bacterium]
MSIGLILKHHTFYNTTHESFKSHFTTEKTLEEKIKSIQDRLEADVNYPKFKFRLQVHEFEAFLFSNPGILATHFGVDTSKKTEIEQILNTFGNNPELINNHPDTAPSKRLEKLFPGYGKISDGIPLATKIGVNKIREKCMYFDKVCTLLE